MGTILFNPLALKDASQANNQPTNRRSPPTRARVTPFTGTPVPLGASIQASPKKQVQSVAARLSQKPMMPADPADHVQITVTRPDVSPLPLYVAYVAANRLNGKMVYGKEDETFVNELDKAVRQKVSEIMAEHGIIPMTGISAENDKAVKNFYPKDLKDLVHLALNQNTLKKINVNFLTADSQNGRRVDGERAFVTLEYKITPIHGGLPKQKIPPEERL